MLVNMYCNNAPWRNEPRSFVCVSVCQCVQPLFNLKVRQRDRRIGDQRIGLGETDKGACHHFFNEQLDPISKGQQSLSKSPSCPPCQCYPPCYLSCLSVSMIPQTSLSPSPVWQPAARKPSDTSSNLATRIMLNLQRGGGSHVIYEATHTHPYKKAAIHTFSSTV